jgi:hypothetical protein
VIAALSPREKILLEKAHLFQKYQVTRNVTGLGELFAVNAVTNIPLGTAKNVGKKAILDSFAEYFATIKETHQKVLGGIEINEGYLAYSKQISSINVKDCHVSYHVINWYQFNDNDLIQEFSAVFNLTSVKEQGACHKNLQPSK